MIEKQALGLKYEDRMMLVDDADRQARWYFELKAAYLESRQHQYADEKPAGRPGNAPLALVAAKCVRKFTRLRKSFAI